MSGLAREAFSDEMDRKQADKSSEDSKVPASCALWPVDLKLTHCDCSPGNVLIHFQGQYASICELDYNILQVEIQNVPKTTVSVEVGDLCLVEDLLSSYWYRGRVQDKSEDLFDVFLLDHGNILTVSPNHLSTVSDSLLMLPPKIICGFIANVLPVQDFWDQTSEAYFSSLIGRHIKGYIHGLLPCKVLILEVPEITKDLLRLNLGRHVDTDTFLLLMELVIEVPIQQSCESVPDLLVDKQIAQEISFKSSDLCGYENVLSLGGSKLAVGQKENIKIVAAIKPGLFYCQLSSAAKDLKEMSDKLALLCESRNSDFRAKSGENIGLLCAIKGKDEKWHRGLVQCLPVNSQVRVVFVDYGYYESVNVKNLFQLPSEFLLRPVMAFPCSLSCLGEEDKATYNQQLVLLRKGVLGKELVITVKGKEKNVCSVMLSDVVEYVPSQTVQSKEVNKVASNDIHINLHQWSSILNETKTVEISNGSVFEGYIEHVQSPHDFWMRTAKTNDRFVAMMNKLTDRFSRIQLNDEILEDPVPGQLCCAMYEKDMHYYRAIVVDLLKYGAEVFFIDFGNTEKVPSMLIKKIPVEFTVEPAFVFNCSLAHVIPLGDVWTASTTDFFRATTSNKAFLVHVIYKRNDVLVVELLEKGCKKHKSLATLLTSANMAEYWTYNAINAPGTSVGKKKKTCNKSTGELLDKMPCKSMSQNLPSIRQMTIGTDKQVHTETAGEIFKSQKFNPGDVISVQCSHISSPSDFWCQNKKTKNDLDRLMERLQTFYLTNTLVLQPQSVCCAVQLQKDNMWYRGCILEGNGLNIKVILVDYGYVVQEKLKKVQAINPEFLELEKQAFKCSLYNLTDPFGGDMWSVKATTLLKKFTSKSWNLQCKIYSQGFASDEGLCSLVDLYTHFQRASTHLIENGVAKEIESPNQLLPSVYPCSFVYSSFDIKIGNEELVYPTHVVSPWEIYLQLDRNTEIIEQLMDGAMKVSEELLSQTHSGEPGSLCLAKYSEDGKWYRSFVWSAQSSLHSNVFFVDYGSKQVAEKRNVLPIPIEATDLLITPMQALRCSLLRISEEENLSEVKTWLEKAILNKELRAKFLKTNSSGHFLCDLFDGDIHINAKVREMFAIHGQAGKSLKNPLNVSNTKGRYHVVKSQRNPGYSKVMQADEQFCQKKSSKFKYPQNPAKNGWSKEKHSPKSTKQCQKEKATIFQHQPSKVLPKVCDLPAIKIAPGFRSIGFISHSNSAHSFFIQMEKDEEDLLKMREELNSSSFTESLQSVPSNVKAGDLVAARYNEDLALYRAAVNSVASRDHLIVEFVDYGNTAMVDKKKMYTLPSKFLSKARLSIHCKLSKPYNLEEVESLLSDPHDQTLMVEFVKNLGYAWEVSIQGLKPLHESRESDPEVIVSDSGHSKQRQEHEDGTSLRRICDKTAVEVGSIVEETLESGTNGSKMVQKKSLEKMQATRATGCMKKLRTMRRPRAYKRKREETQHGCESSLPQKPEIHIGVVEKELLNVSHKSCARIDSNISTALPESVDGQDICVKNGQSVASQPHSEYNCAAPTVIPPEKPMKKVEDIFRLFLAPVRKNHEYSGFAAAVTTPGDFYLVLEDLLLIMSAVSNALEDLPEDLIPLPETHLISGTGCLVWSEERKKWCRAEILQSDDISVIVNLIDYGYCVRLASQDVLKIKSLPVELARYPKITYPCLLRGIKPADGVQWTNQAAMFFQQFIYQKTLKIHFRQYVSEAQWEVDVVASNRNVAKELVDAGHAHYIDTVLGIRFQQGLGRQKEITSSSFVRNVYGAESRIQTQSKMEEMLHGYLEDVSLNDDKDISRGSTTEGKTEDPKQGSALKTNGLQSLNQRSDLLVTTIDHPDFLPLLFPVLPCSWLRFLGSTQVSED
ncbi:tudor domain-containing protein 15 isoform X1 [Silurus meridionalis]|uniref:tudor domain-containing protein 15 isoform X1 n=1 Tax=Silurus meridionalis TaxID=175797 RepID=UPI001EEB0068|nr:tudor domain-containing protein 15 isoform X1 [Silurus meridionalis]XP_046692907.1 tudor domain-containing protein 15 isoform X1 [Silurus meridionalis]